MEKKFLYRRLKVNNKHYYQLYKIVDINENNEVLENKPGVNVDEFCIVTSQEFNKKDISDLLYTYYHLEDEDIIMENDPIVITKLHEKFYNHFKDFDLVPKNEFDVEELCELCNEKVSFQEEAIKDTLNIMKSNLDVLDSGISDDQKRKLKHNIILYGPSGFGKKTFIETILNNTSVPAAILELGADPDKNLRMLVGSLGSSAMGNFKKAENSIVFILDNIDSLYEENGYTEEEFNPYDVIENLMLNKSATMGKNSDVVFDLSKITYVFLKDTPTNNPENIMDDGMSQYLYDQFDEIICFNRLTKEQIKEVILNDPFNAINTYKEVCFQMGKELIIEDDFLDTLIAKAYYGLGGISLINNYIESMIKVRWNNQKIVLNSECVEKEVADTTYLQDWIVKNEDSSLEDVDKKEVNDSPQNVSTKIDLSRIREDYHKKLSTLMEYVKGQDEPLKNILYHAIINDAFQNSNLPPDMKKERINHMLIRGGTGTGKSYITSLVAKSLNNKPYTVVDCKRFTQAGYVGKSVDDILIQLYYIAGCDLEKAQKGTVVLDEFDKLARSGHGEDVSRGAVQESLLKMLEGAVFDLEIKEGGHSKIINFDTRETNFIGAGAFEGLEKIKEARLKRGTKKQGIGFQTESKEEKPFVDTNYTLEDMQEFGMDAQLLRRMSFHCDLNKLEKEDYKNIMLNAKSSSFKIKCELIELFGVKVSYDDEFVEKFVDVVAKLGFGVSGISVLTERIFSSFETKLLDKDYKEVILTKDCVINPKEVILVENIKEEKVLKK